MDDIKPSRWYYAFAALIIVVGGAVFFSYLFSSLDNINKGLNQIIVPGSGDLILQAGKYTVFYEDESVAGGRFYSTSRDISGLQIELKNRSTGTKMPVYIPQGTTTYSVGGRHGSSVLEFVVDKNGIYELSAWYPGRSGPEVVLAVGRNPFDSLMSMIAVGIAIDIGSILTAIAIVATVYQRRRKDEQRLKEEAKAMRGGRLY